MRFQNGSQRRQSMTDATKNPSFSTPTSVIDSMESTSDMGGADPLGNHYFARDVGNLCPKKSNISYNDASASTRTRAAARSGKAWHDRQDRHKLTPPTKIQRRHALYHKRLAR